MRPHDLCSCGTPGRQTLVHLLDSVLGLSLPRQRPAEQYRTSCSPVWKSLFRGEGDDGFGMFPGCLHPLAVLMECGSIVQGRTQAKGVRDLLRQDHRLVDLLQPLVRIAKKPQRPSGIAGHTTPGSSP